MCDRQSQDNPGKGERDREHNHKRVGQRLELSGHHDEYEYDDQYHQYTQIGECILLVFESTTQLPANFRRNIHLFQFGTGLFYQVTQCGTLGYNGRNGNDTFAVLTLDSRRGHTFYNFTHVADTNALSGTVVDDDIFDIFYRLAEFRGITYLYIIFVAIFTIF